MNHAKRNCVGFFDNLGNLKLLKAIQGNTFSSLLFFSFWYGDRIRVVMFGVNGKIVFIGLQNFKY